MVYLPQLLTVAGAGLATRDAAGPSAQITSISFSGTGCPQGSTNNVYNTAGGLTFAFTAFNAQLSSANPGANCEVHLTLDGSGLGGWQLQLAGVDVEGGLTQSDDATVSVYANSFWSESAANTNTQQATYTTGGYHDVSFSKGLALSSPCGSLGIVNVDLMVRLTGGASANFKGRGSNSVTETLAFNWVSC